jgi:hypothetical protein
MTGEQVGLVGLGLFACVVGAGGIFAAIRTRRRRAEIAPTYGSTGGLVYTVVQAGCSTVLLLGGLGVLLAALLIRR